MVDRFLPFFLIFLTLPAFAAAYIDPGSGSLILQFLLAAIFGSLLFIKVLWQRVRSAVVRLFTSSGSSSPLPADSDDK